ncbi:MAG: LytTR family DNA-binding domain-containing protein [Bacteroidia bacterium]|nr:LytTR family DNA-binding domain-containing protein [Bacteroidia bacterium]
MSENTANVDQIPQTSNFPHPYIFVRCESRIIKVLFDDILYIEGMSEYVKIVTKSRTRHLMPLLSMRRMIDSLPSNLFMRVHRSYIVNLDAIDEIHRMHIVIGQDTLPVSEMYKEAFYNWVDRNTAG